MLLTIVFFTHSLSTYFNYKVIFHNIWYKKLLRGTFGVLFSITFRLIILIIWFVWKILWLFSHKLPKSNKVFKNLHPAHRTSIRKTSSDRGRRSCRFPTGRRPTPPGWSCEWWPEIEKIILREASQDKNANAYRDLICNIN